MGTGLESIQDIQKKLENMAFNNTIEAPKISIIVPTYNNESYLAKCLFSIIGQTLKEIEIIVVNDGSTDNTSSILDLFAEYDKRFKVINQKNSKQGAARNRGLEIARGEYIGFVDSDDWISLDYFEKLYTAAKKYDSDLALGTNVRIGRKKEKARLNIKEEKFVTSMQDKFDICNLHKEACPTNKIYRLDFLKQNNIVWPEGCLCEDKMFSIQAVYYANGIVSVPKIYYFYFRRPNSSVNKKSKQKYIDRDNARIQVLKFLKSKNVATRDKDFWAIKKNFKFCGITLYQIKESLHTEKHLLFGLLPIWEVSE